MMRAVFSSGIQAFGTLTIGFSVAGMGSAPASGQTLAGRNIPSPIYGVTLDDVSNQILPGEVYSLGAMARVPTARIVFDRGEPASYYSRQIQSLRPVAYIMGELIDSSDMCAYSVSGASGHAIDFASTLGSLVDIWEIGNEVNGSWLCSDVMAQVEAMFDPIYAGGGLTALTFFYEGEPSDPNNCIDNSGGGNDMFTWINENFLANPTAETEKIRLNVNYVLVSWYPDQCPGENPNWPWVYTQLAAIFPNSKVGFGELGTANPQYGSIFEINEINQYYPMAKTLPGLPASYIGGYFWWYFAEEMVPWPGSLGAVLNAALAAGP